MLFQMLNNFSFFFIARDFDFNSPSHQISRRDTLGIPDGKHYPLPSPPHDIPYQLSHLGPSWGPDTPSGYQRYTTVITRRDPIPVTPEGSHVVFLTG